MEIPAQISEFRIHLANQGQFLFAAPSFNLFLALNRVPNIAKGLIINKPRDVVPSRKSRNILPLVLQNPALEMIRHAGIEDTSCAAQNIYVEDAARPVAHFLFLSSRAQPRDPGSHRNITTFIETAAQFQPASNSGHPERSGPAFSCERFLLAGSRSRGTLAQASPLARSIEKPALLLLALRIPKNLPNRSPFHLDHQPRAVPQPRPQNRIARIRLRLFHRPDPIPLRHRTPPQPPQLRKHKPHPMTPLPPRPRLVYPESAAGSRRVHRVLVHSLVRLHKPPQIIRITHAALSHPELRLPVPTSFFQFPSATFLFFATLRLRVRNFFRLSLF